MLTLKDLTNDSKRKQFYQEYEKNFSLVHVDEFNGFKYFRFIFPEGSYITALEHNHDYLTKTAMYRAVITLTQKDDDYRPVASNMTEIVEHIKNQRRD